MVNQCKCLSSKERGKLNCKSHLQRSIVREGGWIVTYCGDGLGQVAFWRWEVTFWQALGCCAIQLLKMSLYGLLCPFLRPRLDPIFIFFCLGRSGCYRVEILDCIFLWVCVCKNGSYVWSLYAVDGIFSSVLSFRTFTSGQRWKLM